MSSTRAAIKLNMFLLGDNGVGKSTWLNRLLGNEAAEAPLLAGWDLGSIEGIYLKGIELEATFKFINASAEPKYEKIVDRHIAQYHDAYLIFYNIGSKQSFANVDTHFTRIKRLNKNNDAIFLLMGMHSSGAIAVSEDEASAKARQFNLQSYYCINPLVEMDFGRLVQPLHYIVQNAATVKVDVRQLDFRSCIKEIDRALKFCWNEDRIAVLNEFKTVLNNFSCFGNRVTRAGLREMQEECCTIVSKARNILDDAFPERVKMAVFAVATAVLLASSIACGLALLSVATLPVLTGVLIAGCVLGGAGSVFTLGCTIYKARENNVYSSIAVSAEQAVRDFPGVRLSKG